LAISRFVKVCALLKRVSEPALSAWSRNVSSRQDTVWDDAFPLFQRHTQLLSLFGIRIDGRNHVPAVMIDRPEQSRHDVSGFGALELPAKLGVETIAQTEELDGV
jgi:hypothetical protein